MEIARIGAVLSVLCLAGVAAAQPCPCDCNADASVRVNELATGVRILLGNGDWVECPAADLDGDLQVGINELVSGVDAALEGCPREGREALAAARARWAAAGLHSYRSLYRIGCLCPGPSEVLLEVEDGAVAALRDPTTGEPVDPLFENNFMTVAQLFDLIERALPQAAVLDVTYDETLGYPVSLFIDRARAVVDDEFSVSISQLEPTAAPCTTSNECDEIGAICVEPGGSVPCGACFTDLPECAGDDACTDPAEICAPAGIESCACDPSVLICKPGCSSDRDCPAATSCDGSRCIPHRCNDDDACPDTFRCEPVDGSRTGVCARRVCTNSDGCRAGFCVNGGCYASRGSCRLLPP